MEKLRLLTWVFRIHEKVGILLEEDNAEFVANNKIQGVRQKPEISQFLRLF